MTPVVSSNIDSVGYEGTDLLVRYSSGVTYKYLGVPKTIFEDVLRAESVGKFINQFIKHNYNFERL